MVDNTSSLAVKALKLCMPVETRTFDAHYPCTVDWGNLETLMNACVE